MAVDSTHSDDTEELQQQICDVLDHDLHSDLMPSDLEAPEPLETLQVLLATSFITGDH